MGRKKGWLLAENMRFELYTVLKKDITLFKHCECDSPSCEFSNKVFI